MPEAVGSLQLPSEFRRCGCRYQGVEEVERAPTLVEEEGSRCTQVVGRGIHHWIALPGSLWPAEPRADWPCSVCLVLEEQGVHLKGPWKDIQWRRTQDMMKERCCSGEQTC